MYVHVQYVPKWSVHTRLEVLSKSGCAVTKRSELWCASPDLVQTWSGRILLARDIGIVLHGFDQLTIFAQSDDAATIYFIREQLLFKSSVYRGYGEIICKHKGFEKSQIYIYINIKMCWLGPYRKPTLVQSQSGHDLILVRWRGMNLMVWSQVLFGPSPVCSVHFILARIVHIHVHVGRYMCMCALRLRDTLRDRNTEFYEN